MPALNRYAFVLSRPEKPEELAVYSSISGGIVRLSRDALTDILAKGEQTDYRFTYQALRQSAVLATTDDRNLVYASLDMRKAMFSILPTFGCNFACGHCYEYGIGDASVMDAETGAATTAFIKRTIREKGYDRVTLHWHGGEPLLHPEIIVAIGAAVQEYCLAQGVAFRSVITTNGSLATPALIAELARRVALEHVQFTFSGPREIHDRERCYAGGAGSFDRLIQNMLGILSTTSVSFEIGFLGNAPDWPARFGFFDYLRALKAGHEVFANAVDTKRCSLRVSRLFPPLRAPGQVPPFRVDQAESPYPERAVGRTFVKGLRLAQSIGFDVSRATYLQGLCALYNNHDYKIDPRGRLFSCHFLTPADAVNIIGDVTAGIDEARKRVLYDGALDYLAREPCDACGYARICHNNCRALVYADTGRIDRICCQKEVYDEILPDLIKLAHGLEDDYRLDDLALEQGKNEMRRIV